MNKLSIRGLTKTFGPLAAVDDLSMDIAGGTIHSVVGENGAGKSTVMKCLYGIYSPDCGEFFADGRALSIKSPKDAMAAGIGMVHQHFMLIPSMSVCKNVVLGSEPTRGPAFDLKKARASVEELIGAYGLDISPDAPAGSLPVGRQQQVEILKLLYRKADTLIFDEPTAVLSPAETGRFFDTLRGFRKSGKTVIFIAHNLGEVLEISDTVSVMRKGRLIAVRKASELDRQSLAELMIGRAIGHSVKTPGPGLSDVPLLEVRGISVPGGTRPILDGLTFQVYGGEILGVAGIAGNGQSELEEVLGGLRKASGEITVAGVDAKDASPLERRAMGMAYIPEDRIRTGLAPLANLVDNTLMGSQYERRFRLGPFLRAKAAIGHTDRVMKDYGVQAAHRWVQSGTLSGGNMQRLVMGRELEHNPLVLIVSQPTRGVDVGGAEEIHRRILKLRDRGAAVLLISQNLDEIMALSDRIAVMYRGKIAALLFGPQATRERIGRIMLGETEAVFREQRA